MRYTWSERNKTTRSYIVASLILFLMSALALLHSVPAFAQNLHRAKYQFQKRDNPDRWEGVKAAEYAGERLALVAALLTIPALQQTTGGDTYRLGLYLPKAERRVTIKVRDYDAFGDEKFHYWMEPTRSTTSMT